MRNITGVHLILIFKYWFQKRILSTDLEKKNIY